MSDIIKVDRLNYKDLFNDLTMCIKRNSFVSISGSNNCGKTSLIRILGRDIKIPQPIIINDKNHNDYKIQEYLKMVQMIIPKEIIFLEDNLADELSYHQIGSGKDQIEVTNFLVRGLKLKKILSKNFTHLTSKEIILSQIAIALIQQPEILLIDNISSYFESNELQAIITFLELYREKYDLTLILTTTDLSVSLLTEHLYIISEGKVALEGTPLEVLQKDNVINKIGLEIPFMIDLSVKLRDYDLVNSIETNLDRMVDKLWK